MGSLAGIKALFDKARAHLKFPAIVLSVVGKDCYSEVRVYVAGDRAREPGSITVVSQERDSEGRRLYYGKISCDGTWHARQDSGAPQGLVQCLEAFAANPEGECIRHGKLTGKCCFCNSALTDERSTAAGYGPVCAKHYGLKW